MPRSGSPHHWQIFGPLLGVLLLTASRLQDQWSESCLGAVVHCLCLVAGVVWCARFPEILQNFSERHILWSLCSVVFHALTLKLPIQTSLSVAPKLPVYSCSGEKCENFSKTSSPTTLKVHLLWKVASKLSREVQGLSLRRIHIARLFFELFHILLPLALRVTRPIQSRTKRCFENKTSLKSSNECKYNGK